jgi:hypothetical protein
MWPRRLAVRLHGLSRVFFWIAGVRGMVTCFGGWSRLTLIPCLSPTMSDIRAELALVLARHRAGVFGVFASVRDVDLVLADVVLREFVVSSRVSSDSCD